MGWVLRLVKNHKPTLRPLLIVTALIALFTSAFNYLLSYSWCFAWYFLSCWSLTSLCLEILGSCSLWLAVDLFICLLVLSDDREVISGSVRCGCSWRVHDVNQVRWNGLTDTHGTQAPGAGTTTTTQSAAATSSLGETTQPATTWYWVVVIVVIAVVCLEKYTLTFSFISLRKMLRFPQNFQGMFRRKLVFREYKR